MRKLRLDTLLARSSSEPYCPDRFDLIWLQFDPQEGREQAGRRPAFVLSPASYNERASLCVLCPITTQVKGYPFEVAVPSGLKTKGAVLADQIKSMSWTERGSQFIECCPDLSGPVLGRIEALIGI